MLVTLGGGKEKSGEIRCCKHQHKQQYTFLYTLGRKLEQDVHAMSQLQFLIVTESSKVFTKRTASGIN